MSSIDNISEQSSPQKRKRGVILSSQGWQRLQAAEYLSAVRDNQGNAYTLEQLSDRTGLSTKTLTKVRRRQSPVDQPTLMAYFEAFGMTINLDDYTNQDTDSDITTPLLMGLLQAPLKGQLSIDSPFYIHRPPAEKLFVQEIFQPGSLIRIRAPRQFGKTSLIAQGLAQAEERGFRAAVVSLQLADSGVFNSLNQFLQWFCAVVSHSLGLSNQVEELWNPMFGSNYSCNHYFENYVLPTIDSPLLLVLDEVNTLFSYPAIASDFFGLLRAWYEQSRHSVSSSQVWQNLRLVIVYSTEVFFQLNINQSPFNVGSLIGLTAFTPDQVIELASRYGVTAPEVYATELIRLVGGNPYLTQLSLFQLSQHPSDPQDLLTTVTTPNSIFDSHLRQQLGYLECHPDLKAAMQQVIRSPDGVELHPVQAFKLQGAGLIRFSKNFAVVSCELYQHYFAQALEI